jgi:hypothetical protein
VTALRNLRISLVLGLALAVVVPSIALAGGVVDPKDMLPDLRMAKPYSLQIQTSLAGKKKLRFGTIVYNVGDGPLEVRGRARDGTVMDEVYQYIANDQGGGREVLNPLARMFYSGDGHNHWHVGDFIMMELYLKSDPTSMRRLKKIGFCLADLRYFPKPLPNVATVTAYPASGCGVESWQTIGPPTRGSGMGISVGRGDDYQPQFAHQSIDITGLPTAIYRLCATANADWLWAERADNHVNNYYWFDLKVNAARSRLTVLGHGRTACRPTVV